MKFEEDCKDCRFLGIYKICANCHSGEQFEEREVADLDFSGNKINHYAEYEEINEDD